MTNNFIQSQIQNINLGEENIEELPVRYDDYTIFNEGPSRNPPTGSPEKTIKFIMDLRKQRQGSLSQLGSNVYTSNVLPTKVERVYQPQVRAQDNIAPFMSLSQSHYYDNHEQQFLDEDVQRKSQILEQSKHYQQQQEIRNKTYQPVYKTYSPAQRQTQTQQPLYQPVQKIIEPQQQIYQTYNNAQKQQESNKQGFSPISKQVEPMKKLYSQIEAIEKPFTPVQKFFEPTQQYTYVSTQINNDHQQRVVSPISKIKQKSYNAVTQQQQQQQQDQIQEQSIPQNQEEEKNETDEQKKQRLLIQLKSTILSDQDIPYIIHQQEQQQNYLMKRQEELAREELNKPKQQTAQMPQIKQVQSSTISSQLYQQPINKTNQDNELRQNYHLEQIKEESHKIETTNKQTDNTLFNLSQTHPLQNTEQFNEPVQGQGYVSPSKLKEKLEKYKNIQEQNLEISDKRVFSPIQKTYVPAQNFEKKYVQPQQIDLNNEDEDLPVRYDNYFVFNEGPSRSSPKGSPEKTIKYQMDLRHSKLPTSIEKNYIQTHDNNVFQTQFVESQIQQEDRLSYNYQQPQVQPYDSPQKNIIKREEYYQQNINNQIQQTNILNNQNAEIQQQPQIMTEQQFKKTYESLNYNYPNITEIEQQNQQQAQTLQEGQNQQEAQIQQQNQQENEQFNYPNQSEVENIEELPIRYDNYSVFNDGPSRQSPTGSPEKTIKYIMDQRHQKYGQSQEERNNPEQQYQSKLVESQIQETRQPQQYNYEQPEVHTYNSPQRNLIERPEQYSNEAQQIFPNAQQVVSVLPQLQQQQQYKQQQDHNEAEQNINVGEQLNQLKQQEMEENLEELPVRYDDYTIFNEGPSRSPPKGSPEKTVKYQIDLRHSKYEDKQKSQQKDNQNQITVQPSQKLEQQINQIKQFEIQDDISHENLIATQYFNEQGKKNMVDVMEDNEKLLVNKLMNKQEDKTNDLLQTIDDDNNIISSQQKQQPEEIAEFTHEETSVEQQNKKLVEEDLLDLDSKE